MNLALRLSEDCSRYIEGINCQKNTQFNLFHLHRYDYFSSLVSFISTLIQKLTESHVNIQLYMSMLIRSSFNIAFTNKHTLTPHPCDLQCHYLQHELQSYCIYALSLASRFINDPVGRLTRIANKCTYKLHLFSWKPDEKSLWATGQIW